MIPRRVIRTAKGARQFAQYIEDEMGSDFPPHILSIRKFESIRSIDQNSLIHVLIRQLAEHTGHSENEMKGILKAMFGVMETVEIGCNKAINPKSTTKYTHQECSDFIERLYQLGAEIGCTFSEDT